jgi:hypothetical protein
VTATGLAAGTYTVTVTDSKGCTTTASATVTQPALLVASATNTGNVNCFGGANGSASATASGGVAPYTYSWNSTPVQTTATATGLAAGTYTVTVTDANSNVATAQVIITQPAASLSVSATLGNDATCLVSTNGSVTSSVTGGTAPYTYLWSSTPAQTSGNASNLAPGAYFVTVTDANGCTSPSNFVTVGTTDDDCDKFVDALADAVDAIVTATAATRSPAPAG